MRRLLILVLVCLQSACGFHLRGNDVMPEAVSSVYVQHESKTLFSDALKNALRFRGVEVAADRASANAVIVVADDQSGQRILSVAVTEGPEEYEVFQVVTWSMSLDGKAVIPSRQLSLTRDYTYDKNDILGKRQEYNSLRQALAEQSANQVLRKIRYSL